jgi:glutamyl-tRNA synthetase
MVYKTRIAPSPTGFIHLGNIRTAYHNWLAARSTGGKFILRIDDTDKERNKEEYVDKIFETFEWLGLDFDETFRQSETEANHLAIAQQLVHDGLAEMIEGGAIRLTNIPHIPDFWNDVVAGEIKVSDKDREVLNNIIIVRSNGSPTYNFSSILDDMFSDVNLIIRGTDHISNTIKQLVILHAVANLKNNQRACEFARKSLDNTKFAHVGLVFEKGKKLSKRDGSSNFDIHRESGSHPDAILNWILRLGWSPSDANFDKNHPIITKDHAKEIFWSAGALRNSSASLDLQKLAYYNKKYKNLK